MKSSKSLEAHLQGQLRQKEAENSRLSVQMKNLKEAATQQKEEVNRLREQVTRLKDQDLNQQPLKLAARVRKGGDEFCVETSVQLRLQLLHTEKKLAAAQSAAETWKHLHKEKVEENHQL
ncbi:outer dense fiber protein 2-like [Thalassophryne amazonica]|uniref:outer dense fiber protein 2-like n=1 Tax=Thalassophryne amazonica TaxID=390379 RepID=UPI001470F8EA|nr:outer dense fiber protein 2-like [Thalassophryne amazonica]